MSFEDRSLRQFRFCIDRGGTFTDVYAEVPANPPWRTVKLLSVDPANYDDACREGIRRVLEDVTGDKIPRSAKLSTERIDWIRMGTTVATNALLERKGERTALCITQGFKDLLEIGNQARPKIFDLTVAKPSSLYEEVIEANERVVPALKGVQYLGSNVVQGTSGEMVEIVKPLDLESLTPLLQGLLNKGIRSLAVVFLHSHVYPDHEQAVARLAETLGFKQVSISSALVAMVRAVPRGFTATVDAYLTPVIRLYLSGFLEGFDEGLKDVTVSFMQSDGGLTPEHRFSGHKAILSGPAGGVVGFARTTFGLETNLPIIGFDMGGTSTDVSRYDGTYEQVLETQTAGVIIQAPQLDINTVAAGGGSILKFQAGTFKVGPESVSAHPGPVCYRKGGQLAVTDANLLLGRVIPDFFPYIFGPNENEPLDLEGTRAAFESLAPTINSYRREHDSHSKEMSVEQIALGFLDVANEAMCRPIRQLTEMKGYETSKHTLACFGGAGPQHACAIARALGMREVIIHRFCGILSAYGMGLADVVEEAQEPYAAVYSLDSLAEAKQRANKLAEVATRQLRLQGFRKDDIKVETLLNLRYEGTDTAMMIREPEDGSSDFAGAFLKQFRQEYGFELQRKAILISDVRVHATGITNILQPVILDKAKNEPQEEGRRHRVYFGSGWHDTPVYMLEKLLWGHTIPGPAVIMSGNSTILVEPDCKAAITKYGNVHIEIAAAQPPATLSRLSMVKADVIQLSIFNNRYMLSTAYLRHK